MFGNAGYGLDTLGTEETVTKIASRRPESVSSKTRRRPNNCVLAIFGDVKADEVKAAVEKAFGELETWNRRRLDRLVRPVDSNTQLSSASRKRATRNRPCSSSAFPARPCTTTTVTRSELLQEACSDLGSRLFLRVREKLGLAYYVGAQNFPGLAPGYFAFYAGTEPEKADLVEKEFLAEAELLRTEGLTAEELKRAKAKIIGQKKIARQDLGRLASTTALDELYGLGYAAHRRRRRALRSRDARTSQSRREKISEAQLRRHRYR